MGTQKKHCYHDGPPWWSKEHRDWWETHPERRTPPRWDRSQWQGHKDWTQDPSMPPWVRRWARKRHHHDERFLFARFAAAFGLFVLLGCGILAVLALAAAFLVQGRLVPSPTLAPAHPFRWIGPLLVFAFLLLIALRRLGALAAHRYTVPLSETMKAADALAEGDLSARVPEGGSGEFRRFTRSFNRMAQALEISDRQRRELLADVAHELRTPLTVIQGNLEGLRDGVYKATPEHLEMVLDETQKLSRLVDDLRLLTLAEAGQLPLDLQVLDVPQLLADVRDAFACQAREAGLHLALDMPASLPPLVADPQRLGQVLGNLVANALRHTPPGGHVTLGATLPPDGDAPHAVRLWVADTGQGIPAADLPRIFDRFWRGDPARSHEAGTGSGLGLAIAKSLIEAHGGRIWAESQVEQGTIVSCVLPLAQSDTLDLS
jgi:signal transduction histidine kinase